MVNGERVKGFNKFCFELAIEVKDKKEAALMLLKAAKKNKGWLEEIQLAGARYYIELNNRQRRSAFESVYFGETEEQRDFRVAGQGKADSRWARTVRRGGIFDFYPLYNGICLGDAKKVDILKQSEIHGKFEDGNRRKKHIFDTIGASMNMKQTVRQTFRTREDYIKNLFDESSKDESIKEDNPVVRIRKALKPLPVHVDPPL